MQVKHGKVFLDPEYFTKMKNESHRSDKTDKYLEESGFKELKKVYFMKRDSHTLLIIFESISGDWLITGNSLIGSRAGSYWLSDLLHSQKIYGIKPTDIINRDDFTLTLEVKTYPDEPDYWDYKETIEQGIDQDILQEISHIRSKYLYEAEQRKVSEHIKYLIENIKTAADDLNCKIKYGERIGINTNATKLEGYPFKPELTTLIMQIDTWINAVEIKSFQCELQQHVECDDGERVFCKECEKVHGEGKCLSCCVGCTHAIIGYCTSEICEKITKFYKEGITDAV